MAERCAACGHEFNGTSKPKWAFTKAGRPAGRVHTTCSTRQADRLIQSYGDSQAGAQLEVWLHWIRTYPERESDAWHAMFLIDEPTDDMTAEESARLDWWMRRDRDPITPERAEQIRAARQVLLDEFRAWRRSLDPVVPPSPASLVYGASDA